MTALKLVNNHRWSDFTGVTSAGRLNSLVAKPIKWPHTHNVTALEEIWFVKYELSRQKCYTPPDPVKFVLQILTCLTSTLLQRYSMLQTFSATSSHGKYNNDINDK